MEPDVSIHRKHQDGRQIKAITAASGPSRNTDHLVYNFDSCSFDNSALQAGFTMSRWRRANAVIHALTSRAVMTSIATLSARRGVSIVKSCAPRFGGVCA